MKINRRHDQAHRKNAVRLIPIWLGCLAAGIFLFQMAGYLLSLQRPAFPIQSRQTETLPQTAVRTEGLMNINAADQAQLDTLPGIGPSLAKAILQFRQENDGFLFLEELMDVSGIGEKRFNDMKPLVYCGPME